MKTNKQKNKQIEYTVKVLTLKMLVSFKNNIFTSKIGLDVLANAVKHLSVLSGMDNNLICNHERLL